MMAWEEPHHGGAVIRHFSLASTILKETCNTSDSPCRPHTAYLPKEAVAGQKLPTIYLLASWMGAGRSMFQWEALREDLPTRLNRLISTKSIPPCVVVCPDLYTDFGGSQYINSSWLGNHGDHIINELIPYVEQHFPVLTGARHRAAIGRSSGGFGALRFAMDYDDAFGAVACHAGDMGFEWVYRRSLIEVCTALAKFQDPIIWINEIRKQKKMSGFETHIMMLLGMCAFYSPNPASSQGFDLPISLRNGELQEPVWRSWLSHDPVEMVERPEVQDRLGKLKHLFIDCGNRDQYFLQFGSRQLIAKFQKMGIAHNYSEFDDNHSGTAYRYDVSLPKLLNVIS